MSQIIVNNWIIDGGWFHVKSSRFYILFILKIKIISYFSNKRKLFLCFWRFLTISLSKKKIHFHWNCKIGILKIMLYFFTGQRCQNFNQRSYTTNSLESLRKIYPHFFFNKSQKLLPVGPIWHLLLDTYRHE